MICSAPGAYSFPPCSMKSTCVSTSQKIASRYVVIGKSVGIKPHRDPGQQVPALNCVGGGVDAATTATLSGVSATSSVLVLCSSASSAVKVLSLLLLVRRIVSPEDTDALRQSFVSYLFQQLGQLAAHLHGIGCRVSQLAHRRMQSRQVAAHAFANGIQGRRRTGTPAVPHHPFQERLGAIVGTPAQPSTSYR